MFSLNLQGFDFMSSQLSDAAVTSVVASLRSFFAGPNANVPLLEEEWRIDLQQGFLKTSDLQNSTIVLNMFWEDVKQFRMSLLLGLPNGQVCWRVFSTCFVPFFFGDAIWLLIQVCFQYPFFLGHGDRV